MRGAYISGKLLDVHASRIYIFPMTKYKTENVFGALVLGLSDAILQGADKQAPEPGQAAAALALLRHEPGMSIEVLRRALQLSHPGTVRLVDRLVKNNLIERRPSTLDRRAVALHLTDNGEKSCTAILSSRQNRLERLLAALDPNERKQLAALTEKLLTNFITDADHAYSVCRLCDLGSCPNCPVEEAVVHNSR